MTAAQLESGVSGCELEATNDHVVMIRRSSALDGDGTDRDWKR